MDARGRKVGEDYRAVMGRCGPILCAWALLCASMSGCASARRAAPNPDLRPCTDGYAITADGWKLGVRHYRPKVADPGKLPVVLCHGLGLNATFWTITDDHLPSQLTARGYQVYVFDIRGSGDNTRVGREEPVNRMMRQTFLREWGERSWTVDDLVTYDVPAILDYVKQDSGQERVNWVGHSLGGMLIFPYLESSPGADRIANFVGMGSTIIQAETPQIDMLRANRALRTLSLVASPGRMGRPLKYFHMPGMEIIDRFYYSNQNVDRETISRFYGYTLEDTGPGALRQLDPYLQYGHMLSADGSVDYTSKLREITTSTLLIAGDGDIMSDVPSTQLTLNALGSADKSLMRFGRAKGYVADYGHCDLVWSRHAATEVFPPLIDWLDQRQPGVKPSPQNATSVRPSTQTAPGTNLGQVSGSPQK
jgi:lysosomal acid lipase/cholesteryl ester hydrolase